MTTHTAMTRRAIACALLLLLPSAAMARQVDEATRAAEKMIRSRWGAILAEVAPRHQLTVEEGSRLVGPDPARAAGYAEALELLWRDPAIASLVSLDPRDPRYVKRVAETVRAEDAKYISQLKDLQGGGAAPKATNARSTNPAAGGLTERGGIAELIALAIDGSNILSANDSAVSLNLGGLALASLADPEVYSELFRYQQHAFLRRIDGTFVFGAKIPQKEITGLSNLPDFDKLLDVFVWNVKLRLWGNRDLRDPRWYPMTLGRASLDGQLETTVAGLVNRKEDSRAILDKTAELRAASGTLPEGLRARAARSPQLFLKATGTHLTKEAGKNKYGAELLFDAGVERADFTANFMYSVIDDVSLGPENVFQIKQATFSGAVTAQLAADAWTPGVAIEWTSGFVASVFTDKAALPVPTKNTWKVFTTIDIPLSKAARIPFSIVYTNDANALEKSKHVKGQIGLSYDFAALATLFGGK